MENIQLFVKNILQNTYKFVLSENEINERVNYLIEDFRKIPILSFCKTILYSNTNNELGKLAIDFRLNFITKNYKNVIMNSISFELDTFPGEMGNNLRNEVLESCIVINHFVFKLFLSGDNCPVCISNAYEDFKNELKVRERTNVETLWNIRNGIISKLSRNQRAFMGSYGIDVDLETNLSEKNIKSIRSEHSDELRCQFLDLVKIKHPNIDISLVQDVNFFG